MSGGGRKATVTVRDCWETVSLSTLVNINQDSVSLLVLFPCFLVITTNILVFFGGNIFDRLFLVFVFIIEISVEKPNGRKFNFGWGLIYTISL